MVAAAGPLHPRTSSPYIAQFPPLVLAVRRRKKRKGKEEEENWMEWEGQGFCSRCLDSPPSLSRTPEEEGGREEMLIKEHATRTVVVLDTGTGCEGGGDTALAFGMPLTKICKQFFER